MEERRRGCFVATEAPPPLLGLVAIAFCHRQAAVLPPRRSKGCLAAVVLCRQAVVSPLITIIVSSVTRGNMNSEEAAQILRRTTRDMLQVSYVVSKGTDRDLRTKFKGIRDLCGSGIVYLSCTPKTSLLLMINKSLMRLYSRRWMFERI